MPEPWFPEKIVLRIAGVIYVFDGGLLADKVLKVTDPDYLKIKFRTEQSPFLEGASFCGVYSSLDEATNSRAARNSED